jgi:hypothetical protein
MIRPLTSHDVKSDRPVLGRPHSPFRGDRKVPRLAANITSENGRKAFVCHGDPKVQNEPLSFAFETVHQGHWSAMGLGRVKTQRRCDGVE